LQTYLGPGEVAVGGTIPVKVILDALVEHSLRLAASGREGVIVPEIFKLEQSLTVRRP